MKKIFKVFGICAIMLFSFYYTEKIALYTQSKSPIMQEINNIKDNLAVASIDAEIIDEYIIPGINGLKVNVNESFAKMKSFKAFNSYYLVFDEVTPKISLEKNKDKIIKQGNPLKRNISILLEYNEKIIEYLQNNNIKANVIMDLSNYNTNTNFEIINGELDNFLKLESLINKADLNNNICLINKNNKEYCIRKNYYLVINNKELNSTNIASIKNSIKSGDIILIKNNTKIEDLNLLINQIKYQDLNIVYLSELITEENN